MHERFIKINKTQELNCEKKILVFEFSDFKAIRHIPYSIFVRESELVQISDKKLKWETHMVPTFVKFKSNSG